MQVQKVNMFRWSNPVKIKLLNWKAKRNLENVSSKFLKRIWQESIAKTYMEKSQKTEEELALTFKKSACLVIVTKSNWPLVKNFPSSMSWYCVLVMNIHISKHSLKLRFLIIFVHREWDIYSIWYQNTIKNLEMGMFITPKHHILYYESPWLN